MELLRCSCSMLGCNPSLLHSILQVGCPCQGPSRRTVSPGAVLSLSASVAVEVRHGSAPTLAASLLDFAAAGRGATWTPGSCHDWTSTG
jgi:hypothetical protein